MRRFLIGPVSALLLVLAMPALQINSTHTWAVRWLREWAPQWYTMANRRTLESYQAAR